MLALFLLACLETRFHQVKHEHMAILDRQQTGDQLRVRFTRATMATLNINQFWGENT